MISDNSEFLGRQVSIGVRGSPPAGERERNTPPTEIVQHGSPPLQLTPGRQATADACATKSPQKKIQVASPGVAPPREAADVPALYVPPEQSEEFFERPSRPPDAINFHSSPPPSPPPSRAPVEGDDYSVRDSLEFLDPRDTEYGLVKQLSVHNGEIKLHFCEPSQVCLSSAAGLPVIPSGCTHNWKEFWDADDAGDLIETFWNGRHHLIRENYEMERHDMDELEPTDDIIVRRSGLPCPVLYHVTSQCVDTGWERDGMRVRCVGWYATKYIVVAGNEIRVGYTQGCGNYLVDVESNPGPERPEYEYVVWCEDIDGVDCLVTYKYYRRMTDEGLREYYKRIVEPLSGPAVGTKIYHGQGSFLVNVETNPGPKKEGVGDKQKCRRCGQLGHMAKKCPTLKPKTRQIAGDRTSTTTGDGKDKEVKPQTKTSSTTDGKDKEVAPQSTKKTCFHCGVYGHEKPACPERGVPARMIRDPEGFCMACGSKHALDVNCIDDFLKFPERAKHSVAIDELLRKVSASGGDPHVRRAIADMRAQARAEADFQKELEEETSGSREAYADQQKLADKLEREVRAAPAADERDATGRIIGKDTLPAQVLDVGDDLYCGKITDQVFLHALKDSLDVVLVNAATRFSRATTLARAKLTRRWATAQESFSKAFKPAIEAVKDVEALALARDAAAQELADISTAAAVYYDTLSSASSDEESFEVIGPNPHTLAKNDFLTARAVPDPTPAPVDEPPKTDDAKFVDFQDSRWERHINALKAKERCGGLFSPVHEISDTIYLKNSEGEPIAMSVASDPLVRSLENLSVIGGATVYIIKSYTEAHAAVVQAAVLDQLHPRTLVHTIVGLTELAKVPLDLAKLYLDAMIRTGTDVLALPYNVAIRSRAQRVDLRFKIRAVEEDGVDRRTASARRYTGLQKDLNYVGHFYSCYEFPEGSKHTGYVSMYSERQLPTITTWVRGSPFLRFECTTRMNVNALQQLNTQEMLYSGVDAPTYKARVINSLKGETTIMPKLFEVLKTGSDSTKVAATVVRSINQGVVPTEDILSQQGAPSLK